ncbi:extracellular nuclease [Seminavis robusta]|uniref:Extracellular nuclease n=1 Tax=Seminavis robusta TaxID=568900 RepID=A0A9N8DR33_9STRA|nr:extracellular nuclease [Seminavis robusta]|eukprot:Sro195_g083340.1 extracellular nuclease (256) ;mRNA; r:88333-89100
MMHFSATKALSFVLLISTTCTVHGQLINEYQPNPPGGDPSNVQVELKGTPGQSFTGCFISIECDLLTFAGNVDRIAEVSGTFDSNGLLVDTIPDLENPSHIAVLLDASCASLVASTSLSTGSPASSFSLPALDAIGVPDSAGDVSNCIPSNHISGFSGGNHFAYTGDEPRLVFRDGNTNDWYAINDPDRGVVYDINGASHDPSEFDTDPTAGTDTFGQKNPSTTTSAPTDVSAGGNGDPHFKVSCGFFDYLLLSG